MQQIDRFDAARSIEPAPNLKPRRVVTEAAAPSEELQRLEKLLQGSPSMVAGRLQDDAEFFHVAVQHAGSGVECVGERLVRMPDFRSVRRPDLKIEQAQFRQMVELLRYVLSQKRLKCCNRDGVA